MAIEFSPETYRKFEETVARYPKKEAAMLPVLSLAQQEFGHLGSEAIEYVAKLMGQSRGELLHHVQHEAHRTPPYSSLPHFALRAARRGKSHQLSQKNFGHRLWPNDAGRQIHAVRGGMSGFVRHGADDAGERRLLRESDGRKYDGNSPAVKIMTGDRWPSPVAGLLSLHSD